MSETSDAESVQSALDSSSSYSGSLSEASGATSLNDNDAASHVTDWDWHTDSYPTLNPLPDDALLTAEWKDMQRILMLMEYQYFATDSDICHKDLQKCEINYLLRVANICGVSLGHVDARDKARSRMRTRRTRGIMLGVPDEPWMKNRNVAPRVSKRPSRKVPRRRFDRKTGVSYSLAEFSKSRIFRGGEMKKEWKNLERKRLAPDSRIIEGNLVSWEECCDALSVSVHICVLCSGTRETIAKEYVLSSCLKKKIRS